MNPRRSHAARERAAAWRGPQFFPHLRVTFKHRKAPGELADGDMLRAWSHVSDAVLAEAIAAAEREIIRAPSHHEGVHWRAVAERRRRVRDLREERRPSPPSTKAKGNDEGTD